MKRIFIVALIAIGALCACRKNPAGDDPRSELKLNYFIVYILEQAGGYTYAVQLSIQETAGVTTTIDAVVFTVHYANGTYSTIRKTGEEIFSSEQLLNYSHLTGIFSLKDVPAPNGPGVRLEAEIFRTEADGFRSSIRVSTAIPPVRHLPQIELFQPDEYYLAPGQSTTLRWRVKNALRVEIDGGIGIVPPEGTWRVTPTRCRSEFTLTAVNADGSVKEDTWILTSFPQVEYRVEGVAVAARIRYRDVKGTIYTVENVPLPWRFAWQDSTAGRLRLYLAARSGRRLGCITLAVYVNGVLYRTVSVCGPDEEALIDAEARS